MRRRSNHTHMQNHTHGLGRNFRKQPGLWANMKATNAHIHTYPSPFPPIGSHLIPLTPVSLLLKIEHPITHIPFVIPRSDTEQLTQKQNDRIYKYLRPASEATPVLSLPAFKVNALQYCQASNNGNMWNQFWNMNGFSVSGVNRVWQQALTQMKSQFTLNAALW